MITLRHLTMRLLGFLAARDLHWIITDTPLWYLAGAIDRAGRRAAEQRDLVREVLR